MKPPSAGEEADQPSTEHCDACAPQATRALRNWESKDKGSVSSAPEDPTDHGANDGVCVAGKLCNSSQALQGPQQVRMRQSISLR